MITSMHVFWELKKKSCFCVVAEHVVLVCNALLTLVVLVAWGSGLELYYSFAVQIVLPNFLLLIHIVHNYSEELSVFNRERMMVRQKGFVKPVFVKD